MVFNHLQIEYLRLTSINNYHRQFRTPSKKQLEKVQRVIRECAYFPPIPIDGNNNVVTGEHFVEAARKMGLQEIPVILLDHLTEEQIRILRIAYDRIAEEAEWNKAVLAEEFRELQLLIPDIDLTLTGFEPPEIDILLNLSLTDPDSALIKALVRAHKWEKALSSNDQKSLSSIAKSEGLEFMYVTRIYRLYFLAPKIKEAILDGTQPRTLTLSRLMHGIPSCWQEQTPLYGF